jgi:hypothetical protein
LNIVSDFEIRISDFSHLMSITYLEAIREAQAYLLREDERVYLYGQDIAGKFGGAFKATKGLAEKFPGRVLNTPISEDAMIGTAIGAAMEGMRPIVESRMSKSETNPNDRTFERGLFLVLAPGLVSDFEF